MKKQIFSFMLSAAIFTTTPLFAMETDQPEDKGKSIRPHISCPSCKPGLKYEKFDLIEGLGYFGILPGEEIISFIEMLPLEDVLSVSKTSMTLYNLCDPRLILKGIAEKQGCIINPTLCMKYQIQLNHPNYLELFSAESTVYQNVPSSQLKYFMRAPSTSNWYPSIFDSTSKNNAYCFSIGNKNFELAISSLIDERCNIFPPKDKVDFVKHDGDNENFRAISTAQLHGINLNATIRIWIRELEPVLIKESEKK